MCDEVLHISLVDDSLCIGSSVISCSFIDHCYVEERCTVRIGGEGEVPGPQAANTWM